MDVAGLALRVEELDYASSAIMDLPAAEPLNAPSLPTNFREHEDHPLDTVLVDTVKNPLLSKLLRFDMQSVASDTMIFNATMAQEPNVSQVYCENYQKNTNDPEQVEVRLAGRELLAIPGVLLQPEFGRIRVLDVSRNRISELDDSAFRAAIHLQVLNASKNNIEVVSADI
jgi:Leucine-rich repeat (LRR) protein